MKLNEAKNKVKTKAKKAWTWIKDHKWEIIGSLLVVGGEAAVGYAGYKVGKEHGVDKGYDDVSKILACNTGDQYTTTKLLNGNTLAVKSEIWSPEMIEDGIGVFSFEPRANQRLDDLMRICDARLVGRGKAFDRPEEADTYLLTAWVRNNTTSKEAQE